MNIYVCIYQFVCGYLPFGAAEITKFTSHLLSAYGKVYCCWRYLLILLFGFHLFLIDFSLFTHTQ